MEQTRKRFKLAVVPRPDRVRKIESSFGWIDHRFLRDGHMSRLTPHDNTLYMFFALAGDRHSVSFYRKSKICDLLGYSWDEFETAKARLTQRSHLAFEPFGPHEVDGFYQLLPLPETPGAQ